MKCLYYGEFPGLATGAAQVSRMLMPMIAELGFDIEAVTVNRNVVEWWAKDAFPYTFHDGEDDGHSRAIMKERIQNAEYDLLFMTGDLHILDELMQVPAKAPVVLYAAIDGDLFLGNAEDTWLRTLMAADVPVVYSHYAYDVVLSHVPELEGKLAWIGHGCEPTVFYPLPQEERLKAREECLGIRDPETFIVLNVNRNQLRKDLARTMVAFRIFHEQVPNSWLYLHAKQQDMGGHLPTQALYAGLDFGSVGFTPEWFKEGLGVSRETLNRIYNAADVFVTTSLGEGWGLTTTDAMAAGVPVIGPRNTTFVEQLADRADKSKDEIELPGYLYYKDEYSIHKRGILVKCGGPDLWTMWYGTSNDIRPLTSVTGLVSALYHVYSFREEALARTARARTWTLEHSWEVCKQQWLNLWKDRALPLNPKDVSRPLSLSEAIHGLKTPSTAPCSTTNMISESEPVSTG